MTNQARDESEILDVLRAGPIGVPSHAEAARKREEMLPWLQDQVAALPMRRLEHARTRRRQRLLVSAALGLSAAAVCGLTLLSFDLLSERQAKFDGSLGSDDLGEANPNDKLADQPYFTLLAGRVQSGTMDVLSGSRLGPTSSVMTSGDQSATLRDSSGFEVELAPSSVFSFSAPEHENTTQDTYVRLGSGAARFSVPHLTHGSTLSVLTSSAQITVIGTRFSVEVVDPTRTCVRVFEGRVSVIASGKQVFLSPGEKTGCEPDIADEQSARDRGKVPTIRKEGKTTLAEQNALFSRALSQERRGNYRSAEQAFSTLLSNYPNSTFAPEARAGLSRVTSARKTRE